MGGGGSSGSSTTSNQYMPEDIALRRMGVDYANQAGGLGGQFSQPGPGASLDPWVSDTRNNYYGALNQNGPMSNQQWTQDSRAAAGANPMIGLAAQQMPMAQGYNDMGATQAAMQNVQQYGGPGIGAGQQAGQMTANYGGPGVGAAQQAGQASAAYGGPGQGGNYFGTPQGAMAYDPNLALQGAQRSMQQVIAPQIAQSLVGGGSNPLSGAYAEAISNAGAQMALPINQQVMQNQANWYNPQLQGVIQGGLGQQQSQNQLLSQGFGAEAQGGLARQGAMNQLLSQGFGAEAQGGLAAQQAGNQFLGQGLGGQIQGNLGQQGAQNQYLGQGYGGMLQGGLNQQSNTFNQAMQSPQALAQLEQTRQGNYGAQMGLSSMGSDAAKEDFLRRQGLWQQVASGLYGSGGLGPMSQSTSTNSNQGGGGFKAGGALGGAATGAMMGSLISPGIGTAIGAVGGGVIGGFCWIADALYGEGSEEAQAARAWVSEGWQGETADRFRQEYQKYGPGVAEDIKAGKLSDKEMQWYRVMFHEFVALGRGYLSARDARTV